MTKKQQTMTVTLETTADPITKEVKGRDGDECGYIYLPRSWIGKLVKIFQIRKKA